MKNKAFFLCTLFSIFTLCSYADFLAANSHWVDTEYKINGLDKFPEYVFYARIKMSDVSSQRLQNGDSLWLMGPHGVGGEAIICACKADYAGGEGVKNSYFSASELLGPNFIPSDPIDIRTEAGVADSNNLKAEMIEYTVAGFSHGKLVVYKSKHTKKLYDYKNKVELPDEVEISQEPPMPDLTPTP